MSKMQFERKLKVNLWLTKARWYYLSIIFLVSVFSQSIVDFDAWFYSSVKIFFIIYLLYSINLLFYILLKRVEEDRSQSVLAIVSFFQVGVEVIAFTAIMSLTGGMESVATTFFFLPIFTAAFIYGESGAVKAAVVSGVFVNIMIILQYFGYLDSSLSLSIIPVKVSQNISSFSKAVTTTVFYTLIGLFSGYSLGTMLRQEEELEVDNEKLKEKTAQTENDMKQLDRTAQLLVKRDMELTKTNRELDSKIQELEKSEISLTAALEDVKEASATLEEEKDKTTAVISNFTTPIIVLDKENKLTLFNSAAIKQLGLRLLDYGAQISSQDNYSLSNFHGLIRFEHSYSKLEDEEKGEGVVLAEEMVVKASQHDYNFKVITAKVIGKNGENFGVMKIFYDLTREKVLDKLKSEFISVAAHQLRTPLAAIKWIFEMVLGGDTGEINEEQKKFLTKGHESNERIIALVNDLLNVSRIEEGRFGYSFGIYDFYDILDKTVSMFDSLITKSHVKLTINRDMDMPKVRVDKEKIEMVLQNIFENAVKYTPEYGKIDINCSRSNDKILVSIADNGVGIPEADQAKIFSKFFRATNVMRMQTEGTGLGLFISKNIIEKHGGAVRLESKEGKGTTVTFTLPLIQEA